MGILSLLIILFFYFLVMLIEWVFQVLYLIKIVIDLYICIEWYQGFFCKSQLDVCY